jgi:hypothetical protein
MEHNIICPQCGTIAATVIATTVSSPDAPMEHQPAWVSEFVDEICVIRSDAQSPAQLLLDAYGEWAKDRGQIPQSSKRLGMYLAKLPGVRRYRTAKGRVYSGIALKA